MDATFLLLLLMLSGIFVLAFLAFSGPSPEKAQARRLIAIRGRHSVSAEAMLEARIRRAISTQAVSGNQWLASLIPNPENLQKRINMTGRKWTVSQYMMACAGLTLVIGAFLLLQGYSLLLTLFVAVGLGLLLPHMAVKMLINRRITAFTRNFPDALELLVRGLRSGLPVAETLGVIANEVPGPVGEEFRLVTERIRIGKTMDQALQETAARLGTPEFQFFIITLAIQRETGGNLAETLSNLATVLRQRAQMKLKIRAMSSESKASAYIIGALPFVVFALLTAINSEYMAPFFTSDPTGLFGLSLMQLIGAVGMIWMSIGGFIMAKMVNFEI